MSRRGIRQLQDLRDVISSRCSVVELSASKSRVRPSMLKKIHEHVVPGFDCLVSEGNRSMDEETRTFINEPGTHGPRSRLRGVQ